MWFGDYILSEFGHMSLFFQKNWRWFLFTNTKNYRAFIWSDVMKKVIAYYRKSIKPGKKSKMNAI